MSDEMSNASKRVVVPYVGVDRIIETLNVMYKENNREIPISDLAILLGCGVSNINNVSPTLGLLGLSETKKGIITLTSGGLEFIRALNSKEQEKAKAIIKKGIEKSEVLIFVKSLLETRVQLSGEEIGRAISDRFGKNWKNILSYRNFGNSCASILSFADFGFYNDGILSLKPMTTKTESEIYPPEIGYKPLSLLLTVLYPFDRAKSSDLAKKLKAKGTRLSSELAVCVALGLVERESTGSYRITEAGRKLVDPLISEEEKKQVFSKALLSSPYGDAVLQLSQANKELTTEDIGKALAFYLRRDWSQLTKKLYGKKFLTWLRAGGIAEEKAQGKYAIRVDASKFIEVRNEAVTSKSVIDIARIYEIGRILGALETLTPTAENTKEFEDRISVLRSFFKEHGDLEMVFDLLKKNFQLSIESRNPSIYKTNIEFVRDKIREKMGIATG